MRVKILDTPVRQNVENVIDTFCHAKGKLTTQKIFDAWLNRNTGQIIFDKAAADEEWKPIAISYAYNPDGGEILFLLEDREAPMPGFRGEDVSRTAYKVAHQTMQTLSRIAGTLKGPSDFKTKMEVLKKIQITGEISHEDRNILIESWHPVDRMGAEALLKDMPVGTFVFRRDTFSQILEQQLQEQIKKPLKCFTVTFLQSNEKISELTAVHFDGKWLFYDDDPSLTESAYEDLNALLATRRAQLKFPLYHS